MKKKFSYRLNGADRFQLFFDSVARKNTGSGNVIRAIITVSGIVPEDALRKSILQNEAIRFICNIALHKNRYSAGYGFEQKKTPIDPGGIITFHKGGNAANELKQALSRDCSFFSGSPIYIDVIYIPNQTQVIFSVNHVLMDHAGMENLLASFSEMPVMQVAPPKPLPGKSSFKKIVDAIGATLFVASISGWNMKRLQNESQQGIPAFEKLELSAEETTKIKLRFTNEIKVNALSFFLGTSLHSLDSHNDLLTGKNGNYFIAVPIDRRPAADKEVVLSNFLSFIYFRAKPDEVKGLTTISQIISKQMILQARKMLPEKFSSLLDLFRFVPAFLYRAFIDLPSNGHSGTFAFSLLPNSMLEKKLFLGFPVQDVSHYAPVISPPGLNIVFNEFNGRLKIMLSFDESRISKMKAKELLLTIRKNLLN